MIHIQLVVPLMVCATVCVLTVRAEENGITVHPGETQEVLQNPGMGWIYYDYGAEPYHYDFPEATYVMHSRQWSEVESVEGKRNWEDLKGRIAYWARRGKKSMIRIMNAYPGVEYATPKWVFDAGAHYVRYDHPTWGKGVEPCYWDPIFKQKLRNFIEDFAGHFDGDPDVFTVEIRNYGWWGEWHTNIDWPKEVDKRGTIIELIDMYFNAFKKTRLVAETAREYPYENKQGYEKLTAIDYAIAKGAWIRRDGFGCPYMAPCEIKLLNEQWPHTTLLGEWGESYRGMKTGKFPGRTPASAVQEALDNHVSMLSMGWGGEDAYKLVTEDPELVRDAARRMGYRFVLKEAGFPAIIHARGKLPLRQVWINSGNARCPFKFPLTAYLANDSRRCVWFGKDAEFDQRNWVAGKEYPVNSLFELPADLSPGAYTISCAMVDPEGRPAIQFAVTGIDAQKKLLLGQVTVK